MNLVSPSPRISQRFGKLGYFVGALLLHLIVFVLIATLVIFKAPEPPSPAFQQVRIAAPPPPVPPVPPPSGGEVSNPLEPDLTVVPPPAAPSMAAIKAPSSFNVATVKVAVPNLPQSFAKPIGSELAGVQGNKGTGHGTNSSSNFGTFEPSAESLEGRLFDFKRQKDGSPTDGDIIFDKIKAFLDGGWKFEQWSNIFEVPTRIYATQVFVPYVDAGDVPKIFGVEKEMQASRWAVVYSGKVLPPESGRYRFIGNADDILAVGINGKTVLIGCVRNSDFGSTTNWKKPTEESLPGPGGSLVFGDWIEMNRGEPVTIQILISEVPGGGFGAWLLWQRESAKIPKWADGTICPPVFQMAKKPALPHTDLPPQSWGNEFWKPAN